MIQAIEGFSDLGAKVDSVSLEEKAISQRFGAVGSMPSRVGRNYASGSGLLRPASRNRHRRGPESNLKRESEDNLSKISSRFYGSPNHYYNIAAASNIPDPSKI